MKIALSVLGRFHVFNTAEQLSKHNALNQFFTTYPKYILNRFEICSCMYFNYPALEVMNRIHSKFFKYIFSNLYIRKIFDRKIANNISKENDFYVAWGGYADDSMKKAKKLGVTIVVERGSTHPLYAHSILENEFKKNNLAYGLAYKNLLDFDLNTIEQADYVFVPSSFVKRTFVKYGVPEHKILVNHYGVDLLEFKQIEKEDNIFRVIFCGNLSIQKGSHYLLQSIFELNLKYFEFWHIGGISNEMKPFIKKYKSDKIIYKGVYPQNELYKLYSQGNVFCIPSLQEGMAMVQLQAMACGLPLISSTNTGGDDLITKDGEEGFVIPIRSANAIKCKIQYLYDNQDICKEMGQKAKKRVSDGFTWDDYGDRYVENLEMIMKRR